jgi:hypothetical protein
MWILPRCKMSVKAGPLLEWNKCEAIRGACNR